LRATYKVINSLRWERQDVLVREGEKAMMSIKSVTTPQYHLWTDALHARALAHQARNEWDKGTYVRWTITTAWTALKMCCTDALSVDRFLKDFKRAMDDEIKKAELEEIDWGQGLWGLVCELNKKRRDYIHINATQQELFPDVNEADEAISLARKAIKDIYLRAKKQPPTWVDVDYNPGWDKKPTVFGAFSFIRDGADESDPNVVRVKFIHPDGEFSGDTFPPGTNVYQYIEEQVSKSTVPISVVRIYRGDDVEELKIPNVRGTKRQV
jgi:hypothetical protein